MEAKEKKILTISIILISILLLFTGCINNNSHPPSPMSTLPPKIPSTPTFTPSSDSETLHLEAGIYLNNSEIYKRRYGLEPAETTVTLFVKGDGCPVERTFPIEVILILDVSGSMCNQKLSDAKEAAKRFVSNLNQATDRVGLVSFESTAILNQGLTFSNSLVNTAIDNLACGGSTAIGDGIYMANQELKTSGSNTVWASILLSDGENNRGTHDPLAEALVASNINNTIYTIGLEVGEGATLLQNIANMTGGKYYPAADSSQLEEIYTEIAREIINLAGKDISVTYVLKNYFEVAEHTINPPYKLTLNPDGTTAITWSIESLAVNDTWPASFNVSSNSCDYLPLGVYGDCKIAYTNCKGNTTEVLFPETNVFVKCLPCLTVNLTLNKNSYSRADVLQYKILVTNSQEKKGRIAISYGFVDPTPKTIIIGTYMPDIHPNEIYAFSGDFVIPASFYSGSYVFFAEANDLETECSESESALFSITLS